jgi:2-hydroxy-4-carboxymuconate semialdehyde hemiacetal dehydrogenase
LLGQPRSWTDSLLWHHACHSVDLFLYQSGEDAVLAHAVAGPLSPTLGVPLDLAIQMRTSSGALASISLSFNHQGAQGSTFRYICDEATYIARNDDLTDADGKVIDVGPPKPGGLQRVDQAFVDAIRGGREPNGSVDQCLPAMKVLDRLARQID